VELRPRQDDTEGFQPRGAKPEGCRTIWIGWFRYRPEEQKIRDFFHDGPEVEEVVVATKKSTRGFYAHVTFPTTEDVDRACEKAGESCGDEKMRLDYAYMDKLHGDAGMEDKVDLKRYAPQNEKIEGGRTIFLGDMALGVSEDDVKALFEPTCGPIAMMRLQTNRLKNGQYGHVQFETPKGVEEAVKLAGQDVKGVRLRIDYAPDRPMAFKAAARAAEAAPLDTRTVYLGGLPEGVTDAEITAFMSTAGRVIDVRSGASGKFCHVEFDSSEGARNAVTQMNGKDFKGHPLKVDYAKQRDDSKPGGGRGGAGKAGPLAGGGLNLPGLPGMLPLAALGKGMPLGKGGMPLLNPAMAMAMMKGLPPPGMPLPGLPGGLLPGSAPSAALPKEGAPGKGKGGRGKDGLLPMDDRARDRDRDRDRRDRDRSRSRGRRGDPLDDYLTRDRDLDRFQELEDRRRALDDLERRQKELDQLDAFLASQRGKFGDLPPLPGDPLGFRDDPLRGLPPMDDLYGRDPYRLPPDPRFDPLYDRLDPRRDFDPLDRFDPRLDPRYDRLDDRRDLPFDPRFDRYPDDRLRDDVYGRLDPRDPLPDYGYPRDDRRDDYRDDFRDRDPRDIYDRRDDPRDLPPAPDPRDRDRSPLRALPPPDPRDRPDSRERDVRDPPPVDPQDRDLPPDPRDGRDAEGGDAREKSPPPDGKRASDMYRAYADEDQ
jgi:hypothetical protein